MLLQGYASWREGFLTPSQMQAHGIVHGLPFVAHTGMWSDVALFAPLMATIMNSYARHWTASRWSAALAFGLVASAIMHWGFYVHGSLPGVHVLNGALTSAGIVHFIYMAVGIAVVALFYTATANLGRAVVKGLSILLIVHVMIGTLLPLKIWAAIVHPVWYPEQSILDIPTSVTIVVVAAALCGASWWALRGTRSAVDFR